MPFLGFLLSIEFSDRFSPRGITQLKYKENRYVLRRCYQASTEEGEVVETDARTLPNLGGRVKIWHRDGRFVYVGMSGRRICEGHHS